MSDSPRAVAPERRDGDADTSLRPTTFSGFVGQTRVVDNLQTWIKAAQASERVPHESFVPRNVDKTDLKVTLNQAGEAEVDRDAPLLLLFPAVAVDAGQCTHQARLAVVDVAGRANHDTTKIGGGRFRHSARASWVTQAS